jgi:type 1 glutamine amidotransferase
MKTLPLLAMLLSIALAASASDKKIVFIAGKASHGPGDHEHRAGCLLLKACLDAMKLSARPVYHSPRAAELFGSLARPSRISSVVYSNGWPDKLDAFDGAASVVVYADGGGGHPLLQQDRLKTFSELMNKGVGLVCIHYGVEPTIEKGQKEFLDWIGGAFEINWSVNPHWMADFKSLPGHPITRGVKPFKIQDEWYFHMRFRDGMKGVTAILSAVPDGSTTNRNDGAHSGNPAVREAVKRGDSQIVAWAAERANGGRGFGFTGAHFHRNWANDDFRKTVLNAILWTARAEVPKDGVASTVTPEQLKENLDAKSERRR